MVLLVELLCLLVKSRLTSGWLHPYLYWFNQGEIPMLVKSRPWPRPEMRKNVAMATLLGREGGLYTAQFAPDGQHVLSPGRDLRGVTLPFSWDFGAWSNDFFDVGIVWGVNFVLKQSFSCHLSSLMFSLIPIFVL